MKEEGAMERVEGDGGEVARRFSTIYPRADWPYFSGSFLSILVRHVATLILACRLPSLPAFPPIKIQTNDANLTADRSKTKPSYVTTIRSTAKPTAKPTATGVKSSFIRSNLVSLLCSSYLLYFINRVIA